MNVHYWLTNPLLNPFFTPFIILLGALLGGAACLLLAVQGIRGVVLQGHSVATTAGVPQSVLWQRYRTWFMIALLFALVVFGGPIPVAIFCAFLCWQGVREYAVLTALSPWLCAVMIGAGWLTCAAVLVWGPNVLSFMPVIAFFAWSLLALYPSREHEQLAERFSTSIKSLWGYLYLGWLPVYLLALATSNLSGLLLVVGVGVAFSDIGAFCVGKMLGGPKLAPVLSPGKTWSGVLGNILGAACALLLTSFALHGWSFVLLVLLTLAIACGCVWGDLLESLLKRQSGVKDAGTLLPGFGGLLDRIDSLLIVVPLVYYIAHLFVA